MMVRAFLIGVFLCAVSFSCLAQMWPEPKAPAIEKADPYVAIPGAALSPTPKSSYSGIFDATKMAKTPDALIPAVNAVGGLLNDLAVGGTLRSNTHFVLVFHGAATDGILDNEHYRAKYGIDNPNLATLSKMRKMGVELYVCGQHLAGNKIDPKTLTPDVRVAADAYLVLLAYQNKGYGVMFF